MKISYHSDQRKHEKQIGHIQESEEDEEEEIKKATTFLQRKCSLQHPHQSNFRLNQTLMNIC